MLSKLLLNEVLKRMDPSPLEAMMLRDRMRLAVAEAVGARRAEELFPPEMTTIRIRKPVRYSVRSDFAE